VREGVEGGNSTRNKKTTEGHFKKKPAQIEKAPYRRKEKRDVGMKRVAEVNR